MRMVLTLALLVGSGFTASAQMTYPIRELENSLRASRDSEQRVRREATKQKRIERQQRNSDRGPTTAPSLPGKPLSPAGSQPPQPKEPQM
jgi:hypothetical protein